MSKATSWEVQILSGTLFISSASLASFAGSIR
jgi:hypothetical protein